MDEAFECYKYVKTVYFQIDNHLDMKKQHIFELILLRVSCHLVYVSFHKYPVSSMIVVTCLSLCFGNLKMVTESQPKSISMDFGSPSKGWGSCEKAWCRIGLPEEKDKFSSNLCPIIFAAIKI